MVTMLDPAVSSVIACSKGLGHNPGQLCNRHRAGNEATHLGRCEWRQDLWVCRVRRQVKVTPEFCDAEIRRGFLDHDCDHPRLKFDSAASSAHAGSPVAPPQRRWRRYDFHVPVTVNIADRKIQALGTALNEGGMAVCGETRLQVGNEAKVEFRPPFSNTVVNLGAIVRNRAGNRYGVEFIGASEAERQEIVLLRSMVKMLEARVAYYEERVSSKVVD